jgi:hypothetical protein
VEAVAQTSGVKQQIVPLRCAGGTLSRLTVGPDRLLMPTGPLEQVRARGVEPMVGREVRIARQIVERRQTGSRTLDHCHRNRVAETSEGVVVDRSSNS